MVPVWKECKFGKKFIQQPGAKHIAAKLIRGLCASQFLPSMRLWNSSEPGLVIFEGTGSGVLG
jgi:hypothetical protein